MECRIKMIFAQLIWLQNQKLFQNQSKTNNGKEMFNDSLEKNESNLDEQ